MKKLLVLLFVFIMCFSQLFALNVEDWAEKKANAIKAAYWQSSIRIQKAIDSLNPEILDKLGTILENAKDDLDDIAEDYVAIFNKYGQTACDAISDCYEKYGKKVGDEILEFYDDASKKTVLVFNQLSNSAKKHAVIAIDTMDDYGEKIQNSIVAIEKEYGADAVDLIEDSYLKFGKPVAEKIRKCLEETNPDKRLKLLEEIQKVDSKLKEKVNSVMK